MNYVGLTIGKHSRTWSTLMSKLDCPMVHRGVNTYANGVCSPCCFTANWDSPVQSISDYRKSDFKKYFIEKFSNNEWPTECYRCKETEDAGAKSKRQHEIKKFQKKYGNVPYTHDNKLDVLDLRLSNLCNQACVFCNPVNSSMIQKEVEEFGSLHTESNFGSLKTFEGRWDKIRQSFTTKEIIDQVDDLAIGGRLYFTGGEPSILKQVFEILEYCMATKRNEDLYLEFSSNFHAVNPTFIKLLSQFQGRMWVSFDATGSRYEYIRHHGVWKTASNNLLEFKRQVPQFRIELTPAQFILNAFADFDLCDWAYDNNFDVVHDNFLHFPPWLDIRLLPMKQREKIFKKIQEYKRKRATNNNVSLWQNYEKFILSDYKGKATLLDTETNLDKIDFIRKNNWRKTFPWLHKIIEKHKKDMQ